MAESLAKLLKPVLPQPRLTPEQLEKAKAMREEMVQKLTNAAYTHNKVKERELEQKAAAANDRGEKEQLALEKEMLNERLQHHIDRIEARFAVSSPTRLFYESLHNNDLYKMEDRGDEATSPSTRTRCSTPTCTHKSRTSPHAGAARHDDQHAGLR